MSPELKIDFDPYYGAKAYNDLEVESICIHHLEALQAGNSKVFRTSQELVVYMFRALLYRKYKHLQTQVCFIVEGKGVVYDENMRNASGIYPRSVYEECCDVLLGAA